MSALNHRGFDPFVSFILAKKNDCPSIFGPSRKAKEFYKFFDLEFYPTKKLRNFRMYWPGKGPRSEPRRPVAGFLPIEDFFLRLLSLQYGNGLLHWNFC
jgi:hypothetical protein